MTERILHDLASDVAEALARSNKQLVLAESCTAGLVSATLGAIPGISRSLCGSAVVYQEATKTSWLHVSRELLLEHGAVSAEVAKAMAAGALDMTPHADLAAAITGHLGPNAPPEQDGQLFVALQLRGKPPVVCAGTLSSARNFGAADTLRANRQREATTFLMRRLHEILC